MSAAWPPSDKLSELTVDLVLAYQRRTLRPADVDRLVEAFHRDFEAVIATDRNVVDAYPEMFIEGPPTQAAT